MWRRAAHPASPAGQTCTVAGLNRQFSTIFFNKNVVAVSDTYQDEISDGYPIWDRIYYGWHHILGWHTYPGMEHLPGNFNSATLTRPNEIAFTRTTCEIPGHTAHSVDHTWNSWAYSTQLITYKIPGCTAIMQPSHALCTLYSESARIWCDYGVTFAHVLTYLPNPGTLSKKVMAGKDVVSKLEYSPVNKNQGEQSFAS